MSCLKVMQKTLRDVTFMSSHHCWHGLHGDMVALQLFLFLWVTFTHTLVSNPSKLIKSQVGFWYHQSGVWVASYLGKARSCSVFFGNTVQRDNSNHKAVWASAQLGLILTSWCSEEPSLWDLRSVHTDWDALSFLISQVSTVNSQASYDSLLIHMARPCQRHISNT